MKRHFVANSYPGGGALNKAFTLIEVISVIIVMAIIALIATSVVLSVIDKAEEESRKNSVRGYANSVRLSYAEEILKNTGKPLKELATLKTQGQEVDCEYVKYDDKKTGTLLHSCKVDSIGNYCYINGYVYKDGTVECNSILDLIMNENVPYNTPNIYVVTQIPDGLEYAQSKEISVEYPSLKVIEEKYFIKSSETLEINAIGKCGTEELPGECIEENVSSIESNIWYQVSGNTSFTVNKNLTIEAIIGNKNEYGSKKTYEVNNIDTTEPSISIEGTSTTSNKIIVNAKCEDLESNISKYEYTIDGTNYQESNVFNNLSSTNKYKVKVRCTNGSGMSKEIESEEISLNEIIKPTIEQVSQTPSSGTYAQKRVIRITYNGTGIDNPKYYYSLDNETWIEVGETTKDVEFTSNGYLYAKTVDETGNTANAATFTVTNIDTTVPSASIATSVKTDRATVTATCADNESKIAKYEYSKDNGATWVANGTTASYTFTGLTQGTSYTFAVRCTNGSGLTKTASGAKTTASITKPTIAQASQSPSSGTYAQSRVIKITYTGTNIQTPEYYFKSSVAATVASGVVTHACGTSTNPGTCSASSVTTLAAGYWYRTSNTTPSVTYKSNGYLYAQTWDPADNKAAATTFTVTNVDTAVPTVSASVSGKVATLTLKDNLSLAGYTVTTSTTTPTSWTSVTGTSASKSWTASAAGTYYAWVKDASGRTAYKAFSIASSAFFTSKDFAYTGGIQTFTVPETGTYKLEVWGAQGGSYGTSTGGLGGYAQGTKTLNKNTIIYIVVGGAGTANRSINGEAAGGYNGGGIGRNSGLTASGGTDNRFYGSGGGATHMALSTNRGVLANYASYKSELLIVAGGGGGIGGNGTVSYNAGGGGGTSGSEGLGEFGAVPAGTQTSGGIVSPYDGSDGSFGTGALGTKYGSGGGGGGYYGGGANHYSGGGGGSGYVGGITGGSMQNGVRSGNGYARITLVK